MRYKVDQNERKKLIRRRIEKGSGALRAELALYRILQAVMILGFLALFAAAAGNAVYSFRSGIRGTELILMCAFVICTPIPVIIFSLIPFVVRRHAYKKYLRPWASYEQEELMFYAKTFEQGCVDLFSGEPYLTYRMRYADIRRMEYDMDQEILRVYGPFEVKVWSSRGREQCIDTIPPDPAYDVWMDLMPYYEDFPKLIEELETRSGKKIIRKTGSCSSVGTKEDGPCQV